MQYDYLIVGGGSGGAALAGRLAERRPHATIALIEAGPHTARNWLVNTPLGIAALVPFKLKTNYGYRTEPQPGLAGRRGYQPRGRGLGGSSAINAMIYTRGHPLDYDEWAQLGCDGWSWQDVLPYFREHGVTEEQIDTMLVHTPRRFFEQGNGRGGRNAFLGVREVVGIDAGLAQQLRRVQAEAAGELRVAREGDRPHLRDIIGTGGRGRHRKPHISGWHELSYECRDRKGAGPPHRR